MLYPLLVARLVLVVELVVLVVVLVLLSSVGLRCAFVPLDHGNLPLLVLPTGEPLWPLPYLFVIVRLLVVGLAFLVALGRRSLV